jgi:predicted membrane protein (TIGR00267 family)
MMAEELQLAPVPRWGALRAAALVGLSSLVGSLLPLAPFLFLSVWSASIVSAAITSATLFAVGAYKAITTVGHWLKSGLEMAAIGTSCALIGYLVGKLFQVAPGG